VLGYTYNCIRCYLFESGELKYLDLAMELLNLTTLIYRSKDILFTNS
jgi:hypothetical protein